MKYKDLPPKLKPYAAQIISAWLNNADREHCTENEVEWTGNLYTPGCADVKEYFDFVNFYMRKNKFSGEVCMVFSDGEFPDDTAYFSFAEPA